MWGSALECDRFYAVCYAHSISSTFTTLIVAVSARCDIFGARLLTDLLSLLPLL